MIQVDSTHNRMSRLVPLLAGLVLAVLLLLVEAGAVLAGPVDWHEVASTSEGRQWWDSGSLRRSRAGTISVLSRFQPAASEDKPRPVGDLYVMEIDCGQQLFRDTSINGLPQFRAEWQPTAGDTLITNVITEVCVVASEQLPPAA